MHPFIIPGTSTKRLENALKLIVQSNNGDRALEDLAQAIRLELAKRATKGESL